MMDVANRISQPGDGQRGVGAEVSRSQFRRGRRAGRNRVPGILLWPAQVNISVCVLRSLELLFGTE